ncbi:MAG: nitroreductase family protein [Smithella sp.]
MADFNDLLMLRRSIRKYTAASPPEEWLERMIFAASCAPSPRNSQPVRFIRFESPASRNNLQQTMLKGKDLLLTKAAACDRPKHLRNWINSYWRYSEFIFQAPVLFAVGTVTPEGGFAGHLRQAGIITKSKRDDSDLDISAGLALQGFLLKGRELGLGSCILTAPLAFTGNAGKILGTGEIVIKCFVTVGFADENPPTPGRLSLTTIYSRI